MQRTAKQNRWIARKPRVANAWRLPGPGCYPGLQEQLVGDVCPGAGGATALSPRCGFLGESCIDLRLYLRPLRQRKWLSRLTG